MPWHTTRFIFLTFSLVAFSWLVQEEVAANPSDTIYVTSEQTTWDPNGKKEGIVVTTDLFYREVVRQALMLSVREQFGLMTRDATLREPMPTDPDTPGLIDVKIRTASGKRVEYELLQEERSLMKGELEYRFSGDESGISILANRAYQWAMKEVPEVLEKEGYERSPRPEGDYDQLDIPGEIESKLLTMDVLSQYMAVRMAHAIIDEQGETLGLLAALTRGYGNLSQLTEYYPSHLRLAFDARAMLYGTRMIQLRPESPCGYWNRAYYYVLSGRTWDAMRDLDDAKLLAGDQPRPDWIPLLKLSYDYDYHALAEKAGEENPLQELTALLWYRSVEFSDSRYLNMTIGRKCLKLLPQCTRITNGMNRAGGVSYKHRTTTIGFHQFAALLESGLPKLMAEDALIDRALANIEMPLSSSPPGMLAVREALLAASAEDTSPLSLAVLGRIIDEEIVTMTIYRASFLRDSLGVDASDFLDSMLPFYEGHPHAPLIETFRYPSWAADEHYQKTLADYEAPEGNLFSVRIEMADRVPKEIKYKKTTARKHHRLLFNNCCRREAEYIYKTSLLRNRKSLLTYVKWMGDIHPNSPFRAKTYVRYDWKRVKKKSEWIEEQGRHPAVAGALAKQFAKDGDYEEAEKWYRRYITEAPEYDAYLRLAALYWNHLEDEAKAVETVEEYLTKEDFGLGHSNMSREVAYSLMSRGKIAEALPWAELAADSYSARGLEVLAICKERLGDLDGSLELHEAIDERYDSATTYHFVARSGKGDMKTAWKAKWSAEQKAIETTEFSQLKCQAYHFLYTENPEESLAKFLEIHGLESVDNSLFLLYAAAIADSLGQGALRDELWNKAANVPKEIAPKNSSNEHTKRLARLFLAAEEGTLLQLEKIQQIEPKPRSLSYAKNHYFAGRFCEARGDKQEAILYYAEAAKAAFPVDAVVIDAWRRLRALGEDPTELQTYWFGLAKFAY